MTDRHSLHRRHAAEQVELLRLTADTDGRRGELAALRLGDLTERVLSLDRAVPDEVLTTTKTGRRRRVTLGATSVTLWHQRLQGWQDRLPTGQRLGRWLFSADLDHAERARCGTLGHWFTAFVRRLHHPAAVLPRPATAGRRRRDHLDQMYR